MCSLFSGLINLCCFLSFPLFSVVSAWKTSIDFQNSGGSEEVSVVVVAEQGARSEDFCLLLCGGMRLQLPAA